MCLKLVAGILLVAAMCTGGDGDVPLVGRLTFLRHAASGTLSSVTCLDLATGKSKVLVRATEERPSIRSFRYLPNGQDFLVEMGAGADWYANNEMYQGRLADGSLRRLTDNAVYDGDPVESPDAARIAFTRGWGAGSRIHVLDRQSGEV